MQSLPNEPQESINFQAVWLSMRRRWIPLTAVTMAVVGGAAVSTYLQKPTYEAEGKLLLSKTDRVSSLTDFTEKAREITGLTYNSSPLDTEAEVVRSTPLIEKTIASLQLQDKNGQLLDAEQMQKQIKAKGSRGTDVLTVSYRGNNPTEVANVVNALMEHYLENNVRVNRAEAVAARDFIRKQLPDVEGRVRTAEAALRQFKEANQVVALQEEARVAVQGMNDLTNEINRTRANLADAASRTIALQQQIGLTSAQAIAFTSLSQSTAVQQVLTEYRQIQNQLAIQRTRYQPDHPEIMGLLRKEAALKQQLELRITEALRTTEPISDQDLQLSTLKQGITEDLVKVEAERLGLADRVVVLSNALRQYQTRANSLPQLEQSQRELERRLQVAQTTYEQLLKRLQEVELAENQNVGNARIISSARVPKESIAPRKSLNLALGGILGIVAGILTALLLDAIDKSVKTVAEAQRLTGYPLLGVIPWAGGKYASPNRDTSAPLPARDYPASFIGTSFEMLQTTLGFTMSDHPLRMIAVSSALSDEGKSFIAANLAIATAQMGRRVLLVDADMRRPSQHTIWQRLNLKGLSDVLVDQANFPEIINSPYANLDVLTAGTAPPNPVALLDSQRLAAMLDMATQTYDFIIFDTPALTLAPDALTLSKLVDGILFVVRPKVADSASVNQAKALLAQAGQTVLGMVVNGVSEREKNPYPSGVWLSAKAESRQMTQHLSKPRVLSDESNSTPPIPDDMESRFPKL